MRHLAALLLAVPLVAASPEPAPSMQWMHGEWSGNGEMFGKPSKVTLSIKSAPGSSATELNYTATLPAFRFDAQAVYRVLAKGKIEGRWNDSNGNSHPIGGAVSEGKMVTIWGEPRTEIGRSTYTLDEAGQLMVSDSVLNPDGSWRVFAKATYKRAN